MSADHLDMMLLGKEYRISCTPESRDELLATVAFLMGPNWVFVGVSVAVILAGAVVGGIMSKMGLGQA